MGGEVKLIMKGLEEGVQQQKEMKMGNDFHTRTFKKSVLVVGRGTFSYGRGTSLSPYVSSGNVAHRNNRTE